MTNPKPIYQAKVLFSVVKNCPFWDKGKCRNQVTPIKKCVKTAFYQPPKDCPCLIVAVPCDLKKRYK